MQRYGRYRPPTDRPPRRGRLQAALENAGLAGLTGLTTLPTGGEKTQANWLGTSALPRYRAAPGLQLGERDDDVDELRARASRELEARLRALESAPQQVARAACAARPWVVRSRTSVREPGRRTVRSSTPHGAATLRLTVPTGFSGVPPRAGDAR